MGKIADTLAKAGHDVVVYQPIYEDLGATGTKLARVITRPRDFPYIDTSATQNDAWSLEDKGFSEKMKTLEGLNSIQTRLCHNQLSDEPLIKNLTDEKFDVALAEPFDPCFYGLVAKIGVKSYITTVMAPLPDTSLLGIPSTACFVPIFSADFPPMSYISRAKNLLGLMAIQYFYPRYFVAPVEETIRKFLGSDFVVMNKIKNSAYIFTNVDEHLDYPRPISEKLIYMGGIGQSQPKKLEEKYEKILNESKQGVVLVSFGSVAKSSAMPDVMKKAFLDAFSKFPEITFLWKYENDEDRVAEGYENVITGKWLPQTDLFAHPKLLAFISHGGANSIMEAAYSGIPIICITLHNAPRNAQLVQYRGIGIGLEKKDVLQGRLVDAIQRITTESSFKKNALHLSHMIKSKPMSADERVVRYTEFVAEFGSDNNLDMVGKDLSFVEFYNLDIILSALGVLLLVIFVVFRIFAKLISIIYKRIMLGSKNKIE